MLFSPVVDLIKNSIQPPEDMDNATSANLLKYNFRLIREHLKTYFPSKKLANLYTQIQKYFPGDAHIPTGDFISDSELAIPRTIILMDERGRLRRAGGTDNPLASNEDAIQHIPLVSIDNSTLIYFGGAANRAVDINITKTEKHIQNRIGSTANTLEKVILSAYEEMELSNQDTVPLPKKDRLRSLGVTATYVYPYHGHGIAVEPFGDDDISLKTLIWDYELMRLHQNPSVYFGRDEQLFVENIFLPKIAQFIDVEQGKTIRNIETGRIRVSGAFNPEALFQNCRLTLVGYSLGADVIHRIRNCLVSYLRDLYPEEIVRRALQQVVAVTASGANPYLSDEPNFTTIRCVDIHDKGTLGRNPKLDSFPWRDLPVGDSRTVYNNLNEMTCWIRTPYRDKERINEGYHTEKFCLSRPYFPDIARDAIINSASHKAILPENALDFITLSAAAFRRLIAKPQPGAWALNSVAISKYLAIIILLAGVLTNFVLWSGLTLTT